MATAYEKRENKDYNMINAEQQKAEHTACTPKREVREVAGVKVIVKEDPDTGLVQQTRLTNGSWAR